MAEEATKLAAEQAEATEAERRAAAALRAVEEDIDEETESLKSRCELCRGLPLLCPAGAFVPVDTRMWERQPTTVKLSHL